MGFLENIGLNLHNSKEKSRSVTYNKLSSQRNLAEAEELRELLNNKKNIKTCIMEDSTMKTKPSEKISEPETQQAIKNFNRLKYADRMKIIDAADQKLQDNLAQFIDNNSYLSINYEKTNSKFQTLISEIENLKKNNSIDLKSMKYYLKLYSKISDEYMYYAQTFLDSYNLYNKNLPQESQDLFGTQIKEAVKKGNQFKNTIESYTQLVISKMKEVLAASDDTKSEKIDDFINTIKNIKNESEKFQAESLDTMNSFVPAAIQAENQFYALTSKFAKNDIPQNLNMENKVFENILLDTLLEQTNYTGTKLY